MPSAWRCDRSSLDTLWAFAPASARQEKEGRRSRRARKGLKDDRSQPAIPATAIAGRQVECFKLKEFAVDRAAKKELVATLNGIFRETNVVVVAHYSGLNVAQMQTLRKHMKQAGAAVKVTKNRLDQACPGRHRSGRDCPASSRGRRLIAYSGDPIAAPKVAADFAKGHEKFVILGGAMGKTALDANGVKALAALPSLDELRAKIIGLIRRLRPRSPSSSMLLPPRSRAWCKPMPTKAEALIRNSTIPETMNQ